MEKGKLIINRTRKGFQAQIEFIKKSGKKGIIQISGWRPKDDALNGTSCKFEREGGALIRLVAHDGTELYRRVLHAPSSSSSSKPEGMKDSFDPAKTCLPRDTREALRRLNPDNFFLKWQKGARFDNPNARNPFAFFRTHRGAISFQIQPNFGDIDFSKLASREEQHAERLLGPNNIRSFQYTTAWRLVQGLGMESVYEISMTLHHVYGIPYIPATALKGVVRSHIIRMQYDSKEEQALADSIFCDWFGCPKELVLNRNGKKEIFRSAYGEARRGKLVFFDAYPLKSPSLKPDVMNPHYGPYYQDDKNEKPPADFYDPVPVYFLTVEKTPFQFVFGATEEKVLIDVLGNRTIEDWMRDALENHGIGAKTAVGYGYMVN